MNQNKEVSQNGEEKFLLTITADVLIDNQKLMKVRFCSVCLQSHKNSFLNREYGWNKYQFSLFWRELGQMIWVGKLGIADIVVSNINMKEERIHKWDTPEAEGTLQIDRVERVRA